MTKTEIRKKIRDLKGLMTEADRLHAADAVFAQLEQTAAFMLADNILMYHSLPDELETLRFLKKWNGRKNFFLPRVHGVNLELLPYNESTLEEGYQGIQEPAGSDLFPVEEIEVIVVPGVAFDNKGRRLGRGKGFYDRLLATTKATKIGIGYEFQLIEEVPAEKHDVPMDIVISEKTTLYIKPRSK